MSEEKNNNETEEIKEPEVEVIDNKNENKENKEQKQNIFATGKIPFYKKVWYSISSIKKYDEMKKEGLGSCIYYIFTVFVILSLILAGVGTIFQKQKDEKIYAYLGQTLPEMTFTNNTLSLDNQDAVILDNKDCVDYFRTVIVINTLLEEQEAIEQYKTMATSEHYVTIFLKDKYVVISANYNTEGENEKTLQKAGYDTMGITDLTATYNKQSIISYLSQRNTTMSYISTLFMAYLLSLLLFYAFCIIIISLAMWLITKIAKIRWTIKDSFMNTMYASTLSVIIYSIYILICHFVNIGTSIMDIANILLIFIYIYLLLLKDKKSIANKK